MPPAPPPHNEQKGKIISVGIPVSIVPFSSHSRPDQATPDQTKSRQRLQQLISGGSSNAEFDRLVKERIKNRKEKDDHSIAKLKVQITQLEHALEGEIKRRISSHQELEQTCKKEVQQVEERLATLVQNNTQACETRLEALEERVEDLSQLLHEQLLKDVPSRLKQQTESLGAALEKVTTEFHSEKKELLAREGRILKQVLDYERTLSEQIKKERSTTQEQIQQLRKQLENQQQARQDSNAYFADLMQKELSALRQQLERETRERKVEDDAIVDAMNRYTTKLQSTLNAITSEE